MALRSYKYENIEFQWFKRQTSAFYISIQVKENTSWKSSLNMQQY